MSGFLNRGGFVYSSSKRLGDERGPQAAYVVVAAAAASSIAGAALAELPLSTATAVTVAAVVCGLLAVVRVVLRPSPSLPAAVALRPPAPSRRFAVAQTAIEARRLAGARTPDARSRANHLLPRCRDDRATHDPTRPLVHPVGLAVSHRTRNHRPRDSPPG